MHGLLSLLLFASSTSLATHAIADGSKQVSDVPSIQWQPYSKERFDESMTTDKAVIVWVHAAWCYRSTVDLSAVLDQDLIRKTIQRKEIVALRLDLTNYVSKEAAPPALKSFETRFGEIKIVPQLFLVNPGGTRVVALRGDVETKDVIAALRLVFRSEISDKKGDSTKTDPSKP
jgi:thiol:disulfide interchange protein